MLILSRKEDETIILIIPPSDKPTVVKVTVSSIKATRVALGFDGPRTTKILREEVSELN